MSSNNSCIISIIIPTYRDWDRLQLCVNALNDQSFRRQDFEVIIINNDTKRDIPLDFILPNGFQIIHEPLPGSYSARNAGIKIAKGSIIGFTDSDCLPHKDWIYNAYKYFELYNAERIGGKVEIFFEDKSKKTLAELYESIFAFDQRRNVEKYKGSITANFFTKKEYFSSIGLFDAKKMSGEDFGWNKRANASGKKLIYASDVIVKHPARKSLKELALKRRRVYGAQKKLIFKSPKSIVKEILYLPAFFILFFIERVVRLFKESNYSFFTNLKIIYVIFYLYLVSMSEYIKLIFGAKPIR